MRILILGASGYLGGHLGRAFESHHDVVGTTASSKTPSLERVDIRDTDRVRAVVGRSWDVVLHCAGIVDVDRCQRNPHEVWEVNVDGAATVARFSTAKVVFFSTDYVFDGSRRSYTEEDTPAPLNVYGASKLAAEREILRADGNNLVVRLPFLYGHSVTSNSFIERFRAKTTPAPHPVWCNPLYLPDVAGALRVFMEHSGVLHLGGATVTTRYSFYQRAVERLGLRTTVVAVPARRLHQSAPRPLCSVLRSVRGDFQGRHLEAGLDDLRRQLEIDRSSSGTAPG